VAGPNLVPPQAPSVARSPIVLAMPEPVAKTLGWPNAAITWPALLQRMTTGPRPEGRHRRAQPRRDRALRAGRARCRRRERRGGGAEQATIAAMRALVAGRTTIPADLLAKFPEGARPGPPSPGGLNAAPLSEQAVLAYNQTSRR
jgi:hypothetical protein